MKPARAPVLVAALSWTGGTRAGDVAFDADAWPYSAIGKLDVGFGREPSIVVPTGAFRETAAAMLKAQRR